MLDQLLSYDPADIDREKRIEVARILKARADLLRSTAEVADYRSRAWAGEENLTDIIELKAADLAKLRKDYQQKVFALLKEGVDVDGLIDLLPAFGLGVLSKFKVPLPVMFEALGVDFDNLKMMATGLKELKDLLEE